MQVFPRRTIKDTGFSIALRCKAVGFDFQLYGTPVQLVDYPACNALTAGINDAFNDIFVWVWFYSLKEGSPERAGLTLILSKDVIDNATADF